MTRPLTNWLMLGAFLAACFGVAALGGLFTAPAVRAWYPALAKPSWTPPSWLFGPVWTVLYAMMAVAAWLVWKRAGWNSALLLFAVQLALNGLWSPVFFGLHRPDWGFAVIVALWLAIAGTAAAFWKTSMPAGVLFLPYLAWVSYATVLNFALWRLNPH